MATDSLLQRQESGRRLSVDHGIVVIVGNLRKGQKRGSWPAMSCRDLPRFFRTELKNPHNKTFHLYKDSPFAFHLYSNWLKSGYLYAINDADETIVTWQDEFNGLLDAYYLGMNLKDARFRDTVIDAIAITICSFREGKTFRLPAPASDKFAEVTGTKGFCTLRHLLKCRYPTMRNGLSPPDFPGTSAIELQLLEATITGAAKCKFHEHAQPEDCPQAVQGMGRATDTPMIAENSSFEDHSHGAGMQMLGDTFTYSGL